MTWHVEVDRSQCMASGMCAGAAPDLFALDHDRARALNSDIAEDERALDAADICPAMAITVHDGEKPIGPRP
ncbi:ferredoxin [Streptomyces sp. NPDC090052]|uniref:ferredoxin n=1 Tax=unclassified Streptomyces TaxID=2593676 RepID=UPI002259B3B7|nr:MULTISPECIES: ferredoxin [unclassified Streptomyces]WSS47384.1 ferredoxin [Streptomyces sp. NBC_01180]WSV02285.1 ferredoxin [Streptomyces sp. NBC_01020]WSX40351.1 ferredoxin [Streptomyces sp. NBC_00963]WSX71678.1 ferredoxin [Streptomyces sp. NBC_00932]MCX4728511.1 ferredoxin [Streptomyces sp. NBC_01306]